MPRLSGLARRARRLLGVPPVAPTILMYHRVAEVAVDPWGLAVSPRRFEQQLRAIRRHRTPMALDALVRHLLQGTAPRNAVAVTFDDGYLDNLVNAKPLLVRYGVPATLFVPTGSIGQAEEFWWDELAKLTLGWPEASQGSVEVGDAEAEWAFPTAGTAGAEAARQAAHLRLWQALRAATPTIVAAAMAGLRRAIGTAPRAALDRTMTAAELTAWLEGGLTGIAAHTVTHRPMTALRPDELAVEVAASRARCAELTGREATGFAYPYGDHSETVAAALGRTGLAWACSTRPAAVLPGALDLFDLPRLQVAEARLGRQWREA
jgi:peptidoglycan/xylan/chitin deacetylase (PgdA/CDA1 family)